MKRKRRWAIGAAILGGCVVLALPIASWDQVQAWRLLLGGDTVTIFPDPALAGETVEANLRVVPALRRYICRFQAKTLLCFLATRSERPVILRTPGRNALEAWIDVERKEPRPGITRDDVLPLLRSRGWRIVEQAFPKRAYVVLEPADGPESMGADNEDRYIVGYIVSDIVVKMRDLDGMEKVPARADDTDTFVEDHWALEALKTLLEEATGGSETWSEPNGITANAGSLLVGAPRRLHLDVQQVLDNLRR